MIMKATLAISHAVVMGLLISGTWSLAASISGTVTNKTTGKPSAGDSVVLVDVQAGMADAATATTDAHGHYSFQSPGSGTYLIRANHQGGTYFIAAPQGTSPGDISVYDVAAKLDGVGIDADMILAEAAGGMVRVQERYLVRNTSLPPRALFSNNTFEFVLPPSAILDGASATRPGGLPTNTRPVPLSQKSHYTINIPIQPDQGEKETLFEVQYHMSYGGKFTFTPQPQMPADNLVVYVPKGMTFGAAKGADFRAVQEDPRVQTFVAKSIHPGQNVAFALSGEGQMPREAQGSANPMASGSAGSEGPGGRPGGGIGNPIGTPDPLTSYKGWIFGSLALLMVASAFYFLRKPSLPNTGATTHPVSAAPERKPIAVAQQTTAPSQDQQVHSPATGSDTLLNILRDEMFDLEKDKLSGAISPAEYESSKAGLEAVLKRAMRKH
ncbi:MAG: carboxypeptidase regulatory-like domain-containing protein [Terracidiphilus sp.]|nr:carboxypeptidase regulatory-like domain-containing protein [Terracidiphilus sp.]